MKITVLDNINDQPRALREAYNRRKEFTEPFKEKMLEKDYEKIILFGSGTSYNVSKIAEYYFKHICGISSESFYPTVLSNYEKPDWSNRIDKSKILFFAVSQSGTSISTLEALKKAKNKGYDTVALTEDLDSSIGKEADLALHLLCGKELTPPETRGYTVSLLQMYLLALLTAKIKEKISISRYEDEVTNIERLVNQYNVVLQESKDWYSKNSESLVNSELINILGYGIDYGSALEGMLKIGEMLRIPSIGYEMEEYVHGPTMGLTEKHTILMIGSDGSEWKRCLQLRDLFKKHTDRVHLITNKKTKIDERDIVFSVKTNKYLAPLIYAIPLQLVAAKGAEDIYIDTNINPFGQELGHL